MFLLKLIVEIVSKNEQNVNKCKDVREQIEKKVYELIKIIREEERRVMCEIEEFERYEEVALNRNKDVLNDLDRISEFCETSTKLLNE